MHRRNNHRPHCTQPVTNNQSSNIIIKNGKKKIKSVFFAYVPNLCHEERAQKWNTKKSEIVAKTKKNKNKIKLHFNRRNNKYTNVYSNLHD